MRNLVKLGLVWFAVGLLSVSSTLRAEAALKVRVPERPVVQVAILLDTSGSMSGLIEQAKSELWKIVNELSSARKGGAAPQVQVALYEYGKSSLPASEGYLRMILPLTTDLDKVSEELFALTTNGGDEYCGQVIRSACQGLNWSGSGQDYKVIFIAGNEPFTQGEVDYKKSCRETIAKGIIVNTIFCGNYNEGLNTGWKDGADLADGRYLNIDHNTQAVRIDAPQDKEIALLGSQLNRTYLAYGAAGSVGAARQEEQDQNARAMAPAIAAERVVAKSSASYLNSSWDLVDAHREGKVKIEDLKESELPAEMKPMTNSERKAYLEKTEKERRQIQETINRLNAERKKYVALQLKNQGKNTGSSFGAAVVKVVQEQAAARKFRFE
ncbi:MAG: VWA domain-containing protein [Candidatus Omnitrophica bacterium]|nr:VWA domain-containing protein [Candidatus Omnitrophota bacterium]